MKLSCTCNTIILCTNEHSLFVLVASSIKNGSLTNKEMLLDSHSSSAGRGHAKYTSCKVKKVLTVNQIFWPLLKQAYFQSTSCHMCTPKQHQIGTNISCCFVVMYRQHSCTKPITAVSRYNYYTNPMTTLCNRKLD